MAAPSSKSYQSPNPTRPHNPGSRSSEVGNPMRRSFSGSPFAKPAIVPNSRGFNPVTPANSPSEYPRRLSVGRESLTSFREHEDKENGKDQSTKQARIKSVAPFKSPKNFMSPTISAASKVNASPKKRVLTDRNEPVRTSATLSDLRSSCSSVGLSEALEEPNLKIEIETEKVTGVTDSCDSTVTGLDRVDASQEVSSASKGSRKKVAFDSNILTIPLDDSETSDCVNANEDFQTSPAPKSPFHLLAPLDADPLMPPYDPKINYLSPRPQFLHYKPSPRRMRYLSDEKDGNPLDTFCMEDFPDNDLNEETLSDDSQKEPDVGSSSEMEMAKAADSDETEDVSASEMVEETYGDGEVLVDEEFETIPNAAIVDVVKEAVEVKKVSERRFFTKTKCISLVFVVLVACMVMTGANSPLGNCSYIKGSRFGELFETSKLAESVRVDFDELAQNFWYLYGDTVSYISELIDHLKGDKRVSGFSYYNLTDLQEELWIEKNIRDGSMIEAIPVVEHHDDEVAAVCKMLSEEVEETNILELEEGVGFQVDDGLMIEGALVVEQHDAEVVAGQEDVPEDGDETRNLELEDFELRSEVTEPESPEEEQFQEIVVVATTVTGNEEQQKPDSVQVEASEPAEFQGEKSVSTCDETDSDKKTVIGSENIEAVDVAVNSRSSEAENSTIVESETNVSLFVMGGLALLGLSLPAAAAFFYVKKGSSSMSVVPTPVEQPWANKNFNISPASANVEHTMWQRWSSPNCPTEVDIAGESCPSEMSSFQKKSSLGTGLKGANEAQSQERRPKKNCRRESLASSSSELSMGSQSYGSFTTYEKVACKHRNGDEEVVITPIRRSSRLLKQVTSP